MLCRAVVTAIFLFTATTIAASNASVITIQVPTGSTIYFRYQSYTIPFEQWVSMLTVCLAPLITHLVFGFAEPVILSSPRPRWRDRLTQFNPITIIWRWYSIVYRRIRARHWDRADMAASNAIFWDGHSWDGSEKLMLNSRDWVTKLPEKTHVSVVSGSTLASIAMTLQGIDAAFRIAQIHPGGWRGPFLALPEIFYPIAILSFARLPASIWLSSDYGYERPSTAQELSPEIQLPDGGFSYVSAPLSECSMASFAPFTEDPPLSHSRLEDNTTLGARLWTVFGILFSFVICGTGISNSLVGAGPRPFIIITSATSLALRMFYFTLSSSGLFIIVFYILKGQAGNTVVPCMNATWYKVLNAVIIMLALVAFVLAALETTMLPGGAVTTYGIPPPPP